MAAKKAATLGLNLCQPNNEQKLLKKRPRSGGETNVTDENTTDKIRELANIVSQKYSADVFCFNYEVIPPLDVILTTTISSRKHKNKNVVFVLITEGGSADSAFRMMRFLQATYDSISIIVSGWCKSAGTLMCIGANELYIGDSGELGPLDVQIAKVDEMDEQKSGLAAEAAFEKLQSESFKFFMEFVRNIGESEYRVTLKTASDIAVRMTIGVMQPIFEKLDPVIIGEDYRSNRLALSYAERLNIHSKNLKRTRRFDALDNLLAGYESHGFVIDRKEAENLFKKVSPLSPEMLQLVEAMGADALFPHNRRSQTKPKMEFLNDEPKNDAEANSKSERESEASATRRTSRGTDRTKKLRGNPTSRRSKKEMAGKNGKIQEAP